MKIPKPNLSSPYIPFLLIEGTILILLGAFLKIYQISTANILLSGGLISHFLIWLLVFLHILAAPFPNKVVWIMSMFFFPGLAPVVYWAKVITPNKNK